MIRRPPRSTLSLHDALPICFSTGDDADRGEELFGWIVLEDEPAGAGAERLVDVFVEIERRQDRKSTRLNSSHANISYAVFCLKKKTIVIIFCWLHSLFP